MPLTAFQNTFAGNPLDRAGDRRNDPEWLAEQAENPDALAMVVWQGKPLVEETADGPRLAWLALKHARAVVPDRELFLGLWNGAPVFAVEVEGSVDPSAGPLLVQNPICLAARSRRISSEPPPMTKMRASR